MTEMSKEENKQLSPKEMQIWNKRLEVVGRYMLLGNMRVVSEQTGVDYNTLMDWKRQDWWPEMVEQIKRQNKGKVNKSLTKVIEQSLDVLEDRLENGDYVINQKTGEVVRKPVSVKEASIIANNMIQRQLQLEEFVEKTERSENTVKETLELLAKEMIKYNKQHKPTEYVVIENGEN